MKPIQDQTVNRVRSHNARVRADEAYRLWLRGWSWAAIGRALSISDVAAKKAWKRACAAQAAPPDREDERLRERERLELAYAGIAERVESGNDWAIDRFLGLALRKAALLGLDAPKAEAASVAPVFVEIPVALDGLIQRGPNGRLVERASSGTGNDGSSDN